MSPNGKSAQPRTAPTAFKYALLCSLAAALLTFLFFALHSTAARAALGVGAGVFGLTFVFLILLDPLYRYIRLFRTVFAAWMGVMALPAMQLKVTAPVFFAEMSLEGPPKLVHVAFAALCGLILWRDSLTERPGAKPGKSRLGRTITIVAVYLPILLIVTGAVHFLKEPFAPDNYPGIVQNLPVTQHESFEENAFMKSRSLPVAQPVSKLTTVFFEPKVEGVAPGFVKVQLVQFGSGANGKVSIRARSAGSTSVGQLKGAAELPRQCIYKLAVGDALPVRITNSFGAFGDAYEAMVGPNDVIAVVAIYRGDPLVEGQFKDKDGKQFRDWHHVEVSDLAAKGPIAYFFASGSRNYNVQFVSERAYDFWFSRAGLRFEARAIGTNRLEPSESIDSATFKRVCKQAAEDYEGEPYFGNSFEVLASDGLINTPWAIDASATQSRDVAYVTWTPIGTRPWKE